MSLPLRSANSAPYSVFAYQGTDNIGDAIQTYCLSRLLPGPLRGIFRNDPNQVPDGLFVVNGYLADIPSNYSNSLFAGIFIGKDIDQQLEWIRQSKFPVGARDLYTKELLEKNRIASEFIGCVTLTLPKYFGPRAGIVHVDDGHPHQYKQSHNNLTWPQQWDTAISRLESIKRASLVITTRLHIALPCLAFGTPVVVPSYVEQSAFQPQRLALLKDLGFVFDETMKLDVTPWAERYTSFIRSNIGEIVLTESPLIPNPWLI